MIFNNILYRSLVRKTNSDQANENSPKKFNQKKLVDLWNQNDHQNTDIDVLDNLQ